MSSKEEITLLWAYAATEAASVSEALNQLADAGEASRQAGLETRANADVWSWLWAQRAFPDGEIAMADCEVRIIAARQYLAEHVVELEALHERLRLTT